LRHASLSGSWSGAYRYPGDVAPETVFSAEIEEIGGIFTGTTQEPDMLRGEGVVTADIDGARSGGDVRFSKFMNGSGGMRHVIMYRGQADDALSSIAGVWTIPGDWSGTFVMVRDDTGETVAAEEAAEA
jgi:hypothetical protein